MANRKEIESLLVCNSNMFIPTVLTEVLSHPQLLYLVISGTRNIIQFFSFLNLPNVSIIDYCDMGEGLDWLKKKRQLLALVNQFEIAQLVFFHTEFGGIANWLIKRLSHSSKVSIKYCKIYDKMPLPPHKSFLKVLKVKIKERLYWNMKVDVLDRGRPIPSLPDSFFKDVHAVEIKMPVDGKLISSIISERLLDNNIKSRYVLLTGTVVSEKLCPADVYERLINRVIDILGPNNTVSKCHPRFRDMYGMEKKLRQIPSFIPGNVLIDNYYCYVGFESTLLVEAAVAGKRAISLINLLPVSDNDKKLWIDFFDSRLMGKGKIMFPRTIEEFKTIFNLDNDDNRYNSEKDTSDTD